MLGCTLTRGVWEARKAPVQTEWWLGRQSIYRHQSDNRKKKYEKSEGQLDHGAKPLWAEQTHRSACQDEAKLIFHLKKSSV